MSSSPPDLVSLDKNDSLAWTREEFEIPSARACGADSDGEAIYFCGNSLGLLSKKGRKLLMEEVDVWATSGVTGHFSHPHSRPWKHVDAPITPRLAALIGAKEEEVAHTSTLTSNIHNLFTSFYRPTKRRWRIVIEQGSFPSDWYAIHSHPRIHSAVLSQEQIDNSIIALAPRKGEDILRTEDVIETIQKHGDEIAIVWLPLVQYYTGQLLDIPPISAKAHGVGALIGLDMAHGVGNVETKLNEWNIDFAVWCTYKYLNAGPSGIGGFYIRTGLDDGDRRLAGWWGNESATRFQMAPTFRPTPGAKGYQHSCTPVLSTIPVLATLEMMEKAGFSNMLEKQRLLTGAMESLLKQSKFYRPDARVETDMSLPSGPAGEKGAQKVGFKIITPEYPWRGTQLSLFIMPHRESDGAGQGSMPRIFHRMIKRGLVGDEREPSVIRLSPVVLYNTFQEVGRAVQIFEEALEAEVDWEMGRENQGHREDDDHHHVTGVDVVNKG
ncbi:kynureninase [Kockovaella imperatae]|uniref:Kynureninase n=1 Tax=Kockovaella imperatae TaxID=4999 RepID=A0A1Y1UD91_9TREE|nr:kynureninase [Kockovaella imperatae]ORX35949.1 kynureninase [Kockovaella imperatae]